MRLVLDGRNIEMAEFCRLKVGTATKHPANPLFGQDQEWEVLMVNFYPNVIYDEEERLYKIWYLIYTNSPAFDCTPPEERLPGTYWQRESECRKRLGVTGANDPRKSALGYAVSEDGIRWTKPMMDVCPWKGRPSNLVLPEHGVGVIKDPAEKDPARRYKMIGQTSWFNMAVAFSADGVHWGERIPIPEIDADGDTHNNVLWVPTLGKWVAITRLWDPGFKQKWDTPVINERVVGRSESEDFIHWTKAVDVLRGTKEKQTYAMPIFPYGDAYLGFPAIFEPETDRTQTELAWSPDTITWHRIDAGRPLIPNGEKGDYDWGIIHASRPVFAGDEIRIYYDGSDGRHALDWRNDSLCLATMGPERFAGYEPTDSDQAALLTTRPVELRDGLRITVDAAGGAVSVDVLDMAGNVLLTSAPVCSDVTAEPVSWEEENALGKLPGGLHRLRFRIDRAKVYAFHV